MLRLLRTMITESWRDMDSQLRIDWHEPEDSTSWDGGPAGFCKHDPAELRVPLRAHGCKVK